MSIALGRYLADGVATLTRTHGEFGLAPEDVYEADDGITVVVEVKGGRR